MSAPTRYRARRLDNKEWEYGAAFAKGWHAYIKHPDRKPVEVYRGTICKFTGKLDKNKKEIFENDIVAGKFTWADRALVVWDDDRCGFFLTWVPGHKNWGTDFACHDKYFKLSAVKLEVVDCSDNVK